ncbi:MAG: exonuclease SbcCD subunit D [Tannerella sp.]|jgi:exonuclease SbcD|nr:exonuclease SbcCD subunit D [Tannerella sp.]
MKLLHTSDWHLGQMLYNYDRSAEQQAFLEQLADIVATERPDLMVVSGDVYHQSAPSAAVQRMYIEGMLKVHEACPEMEVVVTAGNHDSSAKLEVDGSLWRHFRVHVVGNLERTGEAVNLEKHIIEVRAVDGQLSGYVVAVPHVYPQNFPALEADTPREERQARFFQALLDKVKERNKEALPVVLMAHLAVGGAEMPGRDEASAGGMDYVPLQDLGEGYDYLALGHIHCPQDMPGSGGRARYAGSPLPTSFDEQYPHSVSIVELEKGLPPCVHPVEIFNPLPCLTLPGKEPVPFEEALQALADFLPAQPAYLRLNVLLDNAYLAPDCNERAFEAARGKACKYCYIKVNRPPKTAEDGGRSLSIQEMQEISPLEIARQYYLATEGQEMDEELCRLLQEAIEKK